MITFKDTDIREALRRKYANTPTLPADFMEKRKLGMAIKRNEYEHDETLQTISAPAGDAVSSDIRNGSNRQLKGLQCLC
jgi:hypothetical protein